MKRVQSDNGGVALLTALAFLFLFSMLGAAFVRSISIDLERTENELAEVRAQAFARGGYEAVVGIIASSLAAGDQLPMLGAEETEIPYPVYRADKSSATGIGPDETTTGYATIRVTDESGKINLNHITPGVVTRLTELTGVVARKIKDSLPDADAPGSIANRAWLSSLSDLVARGLVTESQFTKFNPDLLTVHSVADHSSPEGYLNVNAARPEVLAAVLGIPVNKAEELAGLGPFTSLPALFEAAGKNPAPLTGAGAGAGENLGAEIGFESRCFRIVSKGVVAKAGFRPTCRRIEAVVVFDRLGKPQITYWDERPATADEDEPAAA